MDYGKRAAKGVWGSMIQSAYGAKLAAQRQTHPAQASPAAAGQHGRAQYLNVLAGAAVSARTSAQRWANSAEGKAAKASAKPSKKSTAGAKNRAALEAALKPEPAAAMNRQTPGPLNAPRNQSGSQQNRAVLDAAMEW